MAKAHICVQRRENTEKQIAIMDITGHAPQIIKTTNCLTSTSIQDNDYNIFLTIITSK